MAIEHIAASSGLDPTPWILYCMSGIVGGAMNGALVGLSQWLILRRRFSGARSWFLSTVIGMAVGIGIGVFLGAYWLTGFHIAHNWELGDQLSRSLVVEMAVQGAALQYLPIGLALGVCQWAVLRRYARSSGWWLVMSLAVWPGTIDAQQLTQAAD